MDVDRFDGERLVALESAVEVFESDCIHRCFFMGLMFATEKGPRPFGREPPGLCGMSTRLPPVLFEDAVLDVFAEFPREGAADVLEVFALVEGIERVGDEKAARTVHHAQAADAELVVEDDGRDAFHVAQARAFLEGEDLDVRDRQAVEGGLFVVLGVGLSIHGLLLD